MILTNKQAHMLLQLLQDTLSMNVVGYLSIPFKHRLALLNEIINQQDDELVTIKERAQDKESKL